MKGGHDQSAARAGRAFLFAGEVEYCWQHSKVTGAAQCAATTQDGARCKRKAQPGKKYCWQHANYKPAAKAEAKKPAKPAAKGETKGEGKKPAAKPGAK